MTSHRELIIRISDDDRDKVQQHDVFWATLDPVRTDDLRHDAPRWVGHRLRWYAAWWIEPEDGGPYVGQLACMPWHKPGEPVGSAPRTGWFPMADLSDVWFEDDE
jgi:hypothetical protein